MSAGLYRVAGWFENFENSKSKGYKNKAQHTMPLKFGLGLRRLMQMPDAAEIYGAWVLMTMILAKHQQPRSGWMTHNGKKDGDPLTAEDLSILTGAAATSFEKMFSACSKKVVGWLEIHGQGTMGDCQGTMGDHQGDSVPLNRFIQVNTGSYSDSTPSADAQGPGERVPPPSETAEESETMTLARKCSACRPEYARNIEGFYQVLRPYIADDHRDDLTRTIVADWCLDQANAEKPAQIPTKVLRNELARRHANPDGSPPPPPWAQKKESAPRPQSFSTSPGLEPVDDPRAATPAGAQS